MLEGAYEKGITTLDTAAAYGNAHEVIGAYHQSHPSANFRVNTKIPKGLSVDKYESAIYEYLEVLQISRVKTLMLHSFDDYIKIDGAKNALASLKRQGLIQQTGISVYSNEQLRSALQDNQLDVIQLPFNLLDNWQLRGELIQDAKKKQKEIHVRSVFLQGLFYMDLKSTKLVMIKLRPYLLDLHKLASEADMSIGELAMRYALSFSEIDGVLIGVDGIGQLQDNISLINKGQLPSNVLNSISEVIVASTEWINPVNWYWLY